MARSAKQIAAQKKAARASAAARTRKAKSQGAKQIAAVKPKTSSYTKAAKAKASRQSFSAKPTPKLTKPITSKPVVQRGPMPSQILRATGKLVSGEKPTNQDLDWIHSNLKSKTLRGKTARQGRRVLREFERRSRLRTGWRS